MAPTATFETGKPSTGLFQLKRKASGEVITDLAYNNWGIIGNSNPGLCSFEFDASSNSSVVKLNATPLVAGNGAVIIGTDVLYNNNAGEQQNEHIELTKPYSVVIAEDGVSFDVVFPPVATS